MSFLRLIKLIAHRSLLIARGYNEETMFREVKKEETWRKRQLLRLGHA